MTHYLGSRRALLGASTADLLLDGSGHANTGAATTVSPAITTTGTNRLLVAFVAANGGPVTSITDTAGLTWTFFAKQQVGAESREMWYAIAANQVTGNTLTVTQTSSSFMTADVCGISGADTASPFDGAAVTGANPESISTTVANTFIISGFGMDATPSPTAGTGFTLISGADYNLFQYKIVSTTQTNLSVDTGGSAAASKGVCAAVKAA